MRRVWEASGHLVVEIVVDCAIWIPGGFGTRCLSPSSVAGIRPDAGSFRSEEVNKDWGFTNNVENRAVQHGLEEDLKNLSRDHLLWLNGSDMIVFRVLGQAFTLLRVLVSDFYYQWGMIYARWGQPTRALWYFNRAATMNRRGSKAYYHRGLLFLAIGSPERAIGDFSAALQNKPDHIDARINRSIVYTLTGRHEQALADLEQAVEMGFDRDVLEQQILDARMRAGT